jgi:DNA sulfur modification protein DndE
MQFARLKPWYFCIATVAACMMTGVPFSLRPQPACAQARLPPENIAALKSWSYALALQAATWGSPLVTMYDLRDHDAVGAKAKAPPNTVWRMEDISTPELSKQAGYVTPNVNVIYGFGFLDLRREPIILQAPDSGGLYYMVEIVDMWTNAFAYIGGKTTGYQGGTFALVGPGWKGDLPAGVKRIDSPTPWILIQPRVHIYNDGKLDLAAARKVLAAIRPVGLAEFTGKPPLPAQTYAYPAPDTENPDLPVSVLDFKDPLQFWDLLSEAMNENPPPQDQGTALLPMFKPLGLELGKRWDRTKVSPVVLQSMTEAARSVTQIVGKLPLGSVVNHAFIPPPTIGNFGNDYATRAFVARIGLTANTPFEAIYWGNMLDSEGNFLSGNNKYTITFKQGIPFIPPGFWSITLYDSANNYTVPNPINRYMLGSDSPDLKKNPDGSFTIYIQNDSPGPDNESNWLPSPPSGRFYLIPRAYAPTQQAIDILSNPNAWPVPAVVMVK